MNNRGGSTAVPPSRGGTNPTGGYQAVKFGKTSELVYSQLAPGHPIDLCRYQVANCFMGRSGLINSGGEAGKHDLADAAKTAIRTQIEEILQTDASQQQYLAMLLSVSRSLERIADHATHIAEDVIYMLQGQIVRHGTDGHAK